VILCVLTVASTVAAGQVIDGTRTIGTPTDLPVDIGGPSGNLAPTNGCAAGYEDLVDGSTYLPFNATSPISGGPYTEYADDCHMTTGGALCSFTIGYFEPAGPTVDFTITIYANDASDSDLGDVVAGPYTFPGLPAGLNVLTLIPPDNPIIPKDVWFSVTATPQTAGLVIAGGPPTVGSSHDLFLDVSALGLVFFGGSPLANFMVRLDVDSSVPTHETTWGQGKALVAE